MCLGGGVLASSDSIAAHTPGAICVTMSSVCPCCKVRPFEKAVAENTSMFCLSPARPLEVTMSCKKIQQARPPDSLPFQQRFPPQATGPRPATC